MALDNIKLEYSPLSDSIYMYRHGKKDIHLALEKRKAEFDVMRVLVERMMLNAPNGSEKQITLGDKKYNIRVTPVEDKK